MNDMNFPGFVSSVLKERFISQGNSYTKQNVLRFSSFITLYFLYLCSLGKSCVVNIRSVTLDIMILMLEIFLHEREQRHYHSFCRNLPPFASNCTIYQGKIYFGKHKIVWKAFRQNKTKQSSYCHLMIFASNFRYDILRVSDSARVIKLARYVIRPLLCFHVH